MSDEPRVRAAYDQLRADAAGLDTTTALAANRPRKSRDLRLAGVAGLLVLVGLAVLGVVVLVGGDDGEEADLVATEPLPTGANDETDEPSTQDATTSDTATSSVATPETIVDETTTAETTTEPDATPTPAAVAVVLEAGAIVVADPESGELRRLPLGSPGRQALDLLDRALGDGRRSDSSPDCPNQADRTIRWIGPRLQLEVRDGELIAWRLLPPPPSSPELGRADRLQTAAGIGIGSTRAELEAAYRVELVDSTLGVEFSTGRNPSAPNTIRGLLSGRGRRATITTLWSGEICAFR